jgi:hypothetical protein
MVVRALREEHGACLTHNNARINVQEVKEPFLIARAVAAQKWVVGHTTRDTTLEDGCRCRCSCGDLEADVVGCQDPTSRTSFEESTRIETSQQIIKLNTNTKSKSGRLEETVVICLTCVTVCNNGCGRGRRGRRGCRWSIDC